jgi:uncharacterized protein YutD
MNPPEEVEQLVERFDRNKDQYISGNYNEAQLRQEFVNPFFMTLGWDIDNKQGFAEPYKEVIHEDATIGSTIFVLRKKAKHREVTVQKLDRRGTVSTMKTVDLEEFSESWDTSSSSDNTRMLQKMVSCSTPMKELVAMSKGMVVQDRKQHLRTRLRRGDLPFVLGKNLKRYQLTHETYTSYDELTIIGGTKSLERHSETPRLLIRRTGNIICACYSHERELIESTVYLLTSDKIDITYLLGILNSALLTFYIAAEIDDQYTRISTSADGTA